MPIRLTLAAAVLVFCSAALGQGAAPVLQGAFTASAGPVLYRGKWSARVSSRTPNTAAGSWILLNERNDVVLQGTWSAQKSGVGWKGTWHARILRGRAYSGSWAATQPGPDSKSFSEMLRAATTNGTSGTWRAGDYGGDWRLAPAP